MDDDSFDKFVDSWTDKARSEVSTGSTSAVTELLVWERREWCEPQLSATDAVMFGQQQEKSEYCQYLVAHPTIVSGLKPQL
jgi:ssDNA-binding replication factor A large subunit